MIEWEPRTLADGLGFPEGPVVLDDGAIAFVEITGQRVSVVRDGAYATIAHPGGGPNGATLGADGSIWVANNGGIALGPDGLTQVDDPISGCVQRITPDGTVNTVASGFDAPEPHRPNDLCFAPDGSLYVTDPHNWEDIANLGVGRVWRIDPDGTLTKAADVEWFPNGIAFGPDGRAYVAQTIAQKVLAFDVGDDGTFGPPQEFATAEVGFPDGFCFTADGELIVCGSMGHAISVFDPGGALVETIATGEDTEPTNCCLADGTLYVTLSGTGTLVAVDIDAKPLPLHRG